MNCATGSAVAGQQPAADQFEALGAELGRAHRGAEALGQPGDELVFLLCRDLDRAPHVGAEHRVGHRCLMRQRHRRSLGQALRRRVTVVRHPAGKAADQGDDEAGGNPLQRPAGQESLVAAGHGGGRRRRQRGQAFRQRFIEHRVVEGAQFLFLRLVGARPLGFFRLAAR
jgi:hypothetical protein